MNLLKQAMSRVKADEALKEKTKAYLNRALSDQNKQNIFYARQRKENFLMKKWLVAACAMLAIILTSGGVYAYYKTPVNYVSVDINPSVELGINVFNKVVSAVGVNEDGQSVLENQDILNLDVGEAVNIIVQSAADKDFIADDGSTVIAITAETNDNNKATELQNEGAKGVDEAMSAKQAAAIIYKDCSDPVLRAEAKSLGISPGKYKMIKMLQALDPTITVDQYKDAKVSEIMLKADELMQAAGIDKSQFENAKEAAEKVKALRTSDDEDIQDNDEDDQTQLNNTQDQQKNEDKSNKDKTKQKKHEKKNNSQKIDEDKNDDENDNDEQENDGQQITQDKGGSQIENNTERHDSEKDSESRYESDDEGDD